MTLQKKATRASKRDKFEGRDYSRLLKKAEKREGQIAQIRSRNPDKAQRIEENIRWNKAINRAQGMKVKVHLPYPCIVGG
jgi:hypothetical protein